MERIFEACRQRKIAHADMASLIEDEAVESFISTKDAPLQNKSMRELRALAVSNGLHVKTRILKVDLLRMLSHL